MLYETSQKNLEVSELDTPSLVVDIEQMERNLRDMAQFARESEVKLRPHSKTHKIPELALRQMEYGAIGICTQKVSEAQVMVDGGVKNVFVSNEVIGIEKLRKFAELSRRATMCICVDSVEGITQLTQVARESNTELNCFVDVDCGMHRCGVTPKEAAKLARMVASTGRLSFKGIMGYEGHIGGHPPKEWPALVKESMSIVMRARDEIKQEGLQVEEVVAGGTPTAKITGKYPGVTVVTPGEYILYDCSHIESGLVTMESCALSVFCTVMSKPAEDRAIIDGGLKTFDFDQTEYPRLRDENLGAKVVSFSEEHGVLRLESDRAKKEIRVGDRLELVPYHICTCINLHHNLCLTRNRKVEKVVPVFGRGMVK